jgi:membrane-associated phospholipid phosphatase
VKTNRPPGSALAAVDRLLLAFLVVLALLTLACVPSPDLLVCAIAAVAASIVALARWRGRSAVLRVAHAFVAVPVLAALVNAVGPAIEHLNPHRYDAALAAIDVRFFGAFAAAWAHAGGRPDWLTDAASLAYASYYVLPIACVVVLWNQDRLAEFDRLVFSLTVVLLVSYAAYFIAPAAGPRVPPAQAQMQLGGGAASAALRAFLRGCERNELDAFPSGHTATSLVFLAQAWSMFRRQRFLLAAVVAAIVFSTVYLSLHYVVDVVAGAVLAALVVIALRRFASSRLGSREALLSPG